jgi:hypothetical protein
MRLAFSSTGPLHAGLLALATLTFTVSSALAEYPTTTISQSTFKSRCRSMGGTLDTGGTSRISICKLPGGQTVTCDFSTSPAICIVSRPQAPIGDLLGSSPSSVTMDPGKPGLKLDLGGASTIK